MLLSVTVAAYLLTPLLLGSDWMPQFRYLAPYWPMAAILIAVAAARFAELLNVGQRGVSLPRLRLIAGVVIIAGFGVLYAYQVILAYNPGGKRYGHYGISVGYHAAAVEEYTRAGRKLAEIAKPGDTLAAYAIGAIGYHSGMYVIDAWGQVNKNIVSLEWPERIEYIMSLEPTFVEDISGEATTTGLTKMPEFCSNYRPLDSGPIGGRIYVRKDIER